MMKTKEQLAQRIIGIAETNARREIQHAKAVAAIIFKDFPKEISERYYRLHVTNDKIAYLGKLRKPSETARLMLSNLAYMNYQAETRKKESVK